MVLFALAVGCGAHPPAATAPGPREPELDESAGLHLLALPRPTPGRVWLSLWIDAGARDASPPQLATVAAWSAAGEGVEGRALADAVELSLPCETAALMSCLDRLAHAIRAREVSTPRLTDALRRLRSARGTTGGDALRASDRLALEALLGESIDPLGDASDDTRIDERTLSAFLADHFGRDRALIIAVGDIDADTLRAAAAEAFADVPAARSQRASRAAPSTRAQVDVGDHDALSAAAIFGPPSHAVTAAQRWVARVGGDAGATVFPVRGGTALVVRRRGPFAEGLGAAAQDAIDRLREVREELAGAPEAAIPHPEDQPSLARWHGARWASGPVTEIGGLGLGALVDGGRADQLSEDPELPDAARRALALRTLTDALEHVTPLDGTVDDTQARVELANGVLIRGVRLAGTENVAVTVLFEGGAREETARDHGVTALLALATARACSVLAPRELGASPEALGISMRPHVGPTRFGLTVSGPRARWPRIAYLAARCARVRDVDPGLLEIARVDLPRLPSWESALAEAISADAPGRVAVRPSAIPAAGVDDLLRWRDRVAVGARTRLGIAGDLPIESAVHRVARIASHYPAGRRAVSSAWDGPPEGLIAATGSGEAGAWVVRSAPAQANLSGVVAAFAGQTAEAFRSLTPLRVVGERHGIAGGRALVAIFVRGDEASLTELPALVPATAGEPVIPPIPARPSTPSASSLDLAHGPEATTVDPEAARALWRRLNEAEPSFVVVRPTR